MIYDIKLSITYDYASPAVNGRHLACVMPMDGGGQRLLSGFLRMTPDPDEQVDRLDFFGNRVSEFAMRAPHDGIALTLEARVEKQGEAGFFPSVALESLPGQLNQIADLSHFSPLHYVAPSVRVPRHAGMTAFARSALRSGMTVTDAMMAIGHAVHEFMHFDAEATTVDTPAAQAFELRKGVCQDFSHVMVACLRGVGIPAGYVSGFLRTSPPPGKPRLEGADAMHAWVRVWCGPEAGWLEFDPTNDKPADLDHITVAYGRDYSDVAPIKGILRGSGEQTSKQSVDMVPLEEFAGH